MAEALQRCQQRVVLPPVARAVGDAGQRLVDGRDGGTTALRYHNPRRGVRRGLCMPGMLLEALEEIVFAARSNTRHPISGGARGEIFNVPAALHCCLPVNSSLAM